MRRWLAIGVLTVLGGSAHAQDWLSVEIVSFDDFDKLVVRSGRQQFEAFLIGLKPLHAEKIGAMKREFIRQLVMAELASAELSARIFSSDGKRAGITLEAFLHRKHAFTHLWDPKWSYCATSWGGYNFNLYFVHKGYASYLDNFGTDQTGYSWPDLFGRALKERSAGEKPAEQGK